ncbi:MAG: epoxyqueuosine reductase QueH [Spirochaetales bacterium]|jgi:predicted adenine nucleotide alpha hydrolase (AANH) superfamily ATPase|nr:epoxyqueuosine reductase QueH [Spirochaetales bacterium]
MNILLHACCGPCSVYPITVLQKQGHQLTGYFYNPNIHPFREFKRRMASMRLCSAEKGMDTEYVTEYGLIDYLRKVVFHEEGRCGICYLMRLEEVARKTKELGLQGFTSTLLYSRYQKHELICSIAEKMAAKYGVAFVYEDFREGWQWGIDQAIEMDLYRQPYCGCIYSEQERYDKKYATAMENLRNAKE